jgi:AbrB family looped-hinge helix DNA binding protein
MAISSVKVSAQNRISIPRQVRKLLKIKIGDILPASVQDGMLILYPDPQSCSQHLAGLHREIWGNSDDHITKERNAWINLPNQPR